MKTPLRILLSLVWGICIAGVVIIAALSFGIFIWQGFALAVLAGVVLGGPAGTWTEHAIKRSDPFWPPSHV